MIITLLYLAGTLSILLAMPKEQVSGLQGIMQAMQAMTARSASAGWRRSSRCWSTLNALGGVGGWFAATARLPFVAGIDRYLPRAFASLHPAVSHAARRACSCRRRFPRCSSCSVRPARRCAARTTCSSA